MFQIFAHSNLSHQFVFVSIHSRQLADVSENILQTVGQLEGVHVVQTILNVRIDDQFGETQNFTAQMESCKGKEKKNSLDQLLWGYEGIVELTIAET